MNTKNLNEIMQKKFDEYCNSDKIETLFEENIDKSIKEIINDQFRYSGKINKALEEKFKKDININLKDFSLKEYNMRITDIIKKSLDNYMANETKEIKEKIEKELNYDTKEIKLSEIIEKLKDRWLSDDENLKETEMLLLVENKKDNYSETCEIYIHRNYDQPYSKYSYDVHIRLRKREEDNNFKVWHVLYNSNDIKKSDVFSLSWRIETFLYKLFANETAVIIDEDQCDLYYSDED